MFLARLLLIACVTGSFCPAQQVSYPCQPSPEVAQALASLPPAEDFNLTWEQRIGPVRELLKRYPNDLFVHQYYQDMFRRNRGLVDEFDHALDLYRSKPDDPLFEYLRVRLLWTSQARKSRETLERLIKTVPSFPWPHLVLVEMTEVPGVTESKEAETHLRAFLNACPSALEGYAHFKNVKDPELIRSSGEQLRKLLSERTDSMVWRYYPSLWDLEFRATPKERHDEMRQRVRDDVKQLLTLPPTLSSSWYWTFKQASMLAQDPTIKDWRDETVFRKFPNSVLASDITDDRWKLEHPRPSAAKRDEYSKWTMQYFEATEDWLKRWPKAPSLLAVRWQELFRLPELPNEKALEVIDGYADLIKAHADYFLSTPFPIVAADEYVKRQVRLDRVPKMVEEGLRESERQERFRPDPELLSPELRARMIDHVASTRYLAGIILADLFLLTKEASKAQEVLDRMNTDLEARKPAETASPWNKRQYQLERSEYLWRLARLEELEGKKQGALAYYHEMLQPLRRQTVEEDKLDFVQAAKRLYLEQGGKSEDWLAWATSSAKVAHTEPALTFSAPLPDFEVKDFHGRTWRLSDFKGKATLLNVWATWCGACRGELPYIQKLYEQIKDRKDLQVVTISVDDNPGLIESYLKETNFTFPILPTKDLAERIFPVIMLPQTWIVDPQGRRSQDQVVGGSDEWVTRTIAQLARVRESTH